MKILIKKEPALKLKYFVDLVEGEISGIGKSHYDKDNEIIIVDDIIIFEQDCSSASTIISDQAQAKFLYELMKKGEDPEPWNIWWHSHAKMNVFWSQTDDKTIDTHLDEHDSLVSIVTNKDGKFKARVDIAARNIGKYNQTFYNTENIEVEIEKEPFANILKTILKDKEMLKEFLLSNEKLIEKFLEAKLGEDETLMQYCAEEIDKKVKQHKFEIGFNTKSRYLGKQFYLPNGDFDWEKYQLEKYPAPKKIDEYDDYQYLTKKERKQLKKQNLFKRDFDIPDFKKYNSK